MSRVFGIFRESEAYERLEKASDSNRLLESFRSLQNKTWICSRRLFNPQKVPNSKAKK